MSDHASECEVHLYGINRCTCGLLLQTLNQSESVDDVLADGPTILTAIGEWMRRLDAAIARSKEKP